MAYRDIQDFMLELKKRGMLKEIKAEVDSHLEIAEIIDRVVKSNGPALLFTKVKGIEYPLISNIFGSTSRMSLALGVNSLDEIGERITKLLKMPQSMQGGLWAKVKLLPELVNILKFQPKYVKVAPCQTVIENYPNLNTLPILQCWPLDGGKYITMPLVFTRNPENGIQNCGMYRMQIYDSNTTGMHWHVHKDGYHNFLKASNGAEKMDVAVALGCDPAIIYSATAPLPPDIDEMMLAGFLRQEAVEMVKCRTNDLLVPAHAEFILEGYVDIVEKRREGPFGDHTGFYSSPDDYPVFHITCMTRKKNPVYPTLIVGKPLMEDYYLGKITERIFLPFLKIIIPEIIDINFPSEGVFHNCLVVAIRKTYPGQASKVMHAIWGLNQMMFTKMIIVVDAHVNVQNMSQVGWWVLNNIDAERDITIMRGTLDVLDHSSPTALVGSKIGIDATKKMPGEGYKREWPQEIAMCEVIKEKVTRRWQEYGFS